jgi:hypothetical protein
MPFLPVPFVPKPDSNTVKNLRRALGTDREPVRVAVRTGPTERDRDCYVNVRERISTNGSGKMQLGWAVWQHAHLFIEAEPHAVLDPGNDQPWIDCTPHVLPNGTAVGEILFIPNDGAKYDFRTMDVQDNVRVPLTDDPRLLKALDLFAEKTALFNSVPGINVNLPEDVARKVLRVEAEVGMLLAQLMQTASGLPEKIGRNDPCPCASGKKFKKCCGNSVH